MRHITTRGADVVGRMIRQLGARIGFIGALTMVTAGLVGASSAQAQPTTPRCGDSAVADILIMFDITGSHHNDDLEVERQAALSLLAQFESGIERPQFAFGSFNLTIPTQAVIPARMVSPQFTGDYDVLRDLLDRTFPSAVFPPDGISGFGFTDISAPLKVAKDFLASPSTNNNPSAPDYVVLITDGENEVPAGYLDPADSCVDECDCQFLEMRAFGEAEAIKNAGAQIFVAHFNQSDVCTATHGELVGAPNLRDEIASMPSEEFYSVADLSLDNVFMQISDTIVCNDGLSCTMDTCDDQTGFCVFTELDLDNDNVLDCGDLCDGDQGLVGSPCDGGDLDTFACGIFSCPVNGQLVCSDDADIDLDNDRDNIPSCIDLCDEDPLKTAPGVCGCGVEDTDTDGDGNPDCVSVQCTDTDISGTQFAIDGVSERQLRMIKRIARTQRRLSGSRRGSRRNQIVASATQVQANVWSSIWSIPSVQTSCESNIFCVSVSNVASTTAVSSDIASLRSLTDDIISLARRDGLTKRRARRFRRLADSLVTEANTSLDTVPSTNTACTI